MTPKKPARRTLTEHIHAALLDQARRLLAAATPAVREDLRRELASWYEAAVQRITIGIEADRTRTGRMDSRSAYVRVALHTAAGAGELCRVRLRDLVDQQGEPLPTATTVRDLMAQHAPAPDHVPAEWLDAPHSGSQGQDEHRGDDEGQDDRGAR